MPYYMGESFDKETNREYKTEKNGLKAAEEKKLNLYDDEGNLLYDAGNGAEGAGAHETEQTDNSMPHEEKAQETAQSEAEGKEKDNQTMEGIRVELSGKIRRIFKGKLRVRNRPSWEDEAVVGVTTFVEKRVVARYEVDGRKMYETSDGYFITGADDLVEFVEG